MRYEEFEQKTDSFLTSLMASSYSGALVGVIIVLAIIGVLWVVA